MTPFLIEKFGDKLASTAIEVQVTSTNGTYFLPDDAILRNCRVVGLIVSDNQDDSALSPTTLRPLVSNEVVRSSFLTLKSMNDEVIHKHPLNDFLTANQAGDIRLLDFNGFNPQKSFIELSACPLKNVGESFLLHVR